MQNQQFFDNLIMRKQAPQLAVSNQSQGDGNTIELGQLTLSSSIDKKLLQKQKSAIKSNAICGLASRNWQSHQMPKICQYVIEWRHNQAIQLYANYHPTILKDIHEIKFPLLKYMNVWGNQIQTIEGIDRVYWPNLQQICLWDNKIISLKPFRRINAPQLNWLDLKNNLILDHSMLSQFWNKSKKLERLHITTQGDPSQVTKIESGASTNVIISATFNVQKTYKRFKQLQQI